MDRLDAGPSTLDPGPEPSLPEEDDHDFAYLSLRVRPGIRLCRLCLRAGNARNDLRPCARRAGGRHAWRHRDDHQRRHERLGHPDDQLDRLLPGAVAAAGELPCERRAAGLQDVGSQRRHPLGRAAGERRPDAGRRSGERDRHRQRRGPDTRDGRPHHRAEPRSAQRREPADVLEHAGAADAVRHRRQLVRQRAVCRAGVRQSHVERHVCARRRGRQRMDDRRRDQQRQRSASRLVAELRHDRGSPDRDRELRRVVRPRHGPRHLDDDARRHQHDARDRELSILEQPVERAAIFREAELLRQHRAGGKRTATRRWPSRWRRRTSIPAGNRTTWRPRSAARLSGTSSSRS